MTRKQKIYEGKAKILYEGPRSNTLIQYFKDEATAFNAKKKASIEGKGILNNLLSEHFMKGLNLIKVPNHFIERLNTREQLIEKCEIIPLEIVVRNVVAGSMSKRLGLIEGGELSRPLIEFYLKNDELGDPLVTEPTILALKWANKIEIDEMTALALQVNYFLSGLMYAVNIKLVDFKIEFGRSLNEQKKKLIVADEISPDSCRLWDISSGDKLDKDIFREDLGNLLDGYSEIARRLGVLPENFRDQQKK